MREFLPNKSKENQEKLLAFLGFLWPNRDFSKGYSGKNKKIISVPVRLLGCARAASSSFLPVRPTRLARHGRDPLVEFVIGEDYRRRFRFTQENVGRFINSQV